MENTNIDTIEMLTNAEKQADDIELNARKRAEQIVSDANKQSKSIIEDAQKDAEEIIYDAEKRAKLDFEKSISDESNSADSSGNEALNKTADMISFVKDILLK